MVQALRTVERVIQVAYITTVVCDFGMRVYDSANKSMADRKARKEQEERKTQAEQRRVGQIIGGGAANQGAPIEYRLDPGVELESLKCPITMETI